MRDYAQIRPRFWTQGTGKLLRGDREAREMALYLMSAPTSNLIGLYYLPVPTIAHELGYETLEGAREALRRVCDTGFAKYDDESEYVWVINMAREQVGDEPKKKDNRIAGVRNELKKHAKCPFFSAFCELYGEVFGIQPGSPSEAPPKPLEGARESGTGTGTGTGTGDARAREPGFSAQRMRVVFQEAYLNAMGVDPSMGGKNLADFAERVRRTADAQGRDPEAMFRDCLTSWLKRNLSEVERRSPYACFAQAWGDLAAPKPENDQGDDLFRPELRVGGNR